MSGLVIAGQSLDLDGAWKHNRSLRRARSTIRTRGWNRPVPGSAGTIANPVRPDETVVDMELMVFGRVDASSTPYADRLGGLDENLAYLEDWVLGLADGVTTTYTASLETPSGRTFETEAQIINWQILRENLTQVVVGYDLRIPSGVWTETTP